MRIFKTASGDYRVTNEYAFTTGDIISVAHQIARENSDSIVFDWPVITDEEENGIWQIWFIAPEVDSSYLDHEVLF